MTPQSNLKLRTTYGIVRQIVPTTTKDDEQMAAADVAIIKTNLSPRCHLEIGDSKSLRIGAQPIAIGYPGFDIPAAALYDGFLSSRHEKAPIPVGSVGLQTVTTTHELLRIQMPLTPGTSGSPVISDDDKVIGIVSEAPVVWTKQLSDLIAISHVRGFSGGMETSFSNGMKFDPLKVLAELAEVVHDFESPGAGLAVPTRYLKVPSGEARPTSTSSH